MADVRDPDFYLEQASYVRALARRLVYDAHAAEDLFQAAWLAALQRPARDRSAPRRWLARIVRNLASKMWRSAQRRERREDACDPPPPASSPDTVLAHEQERQRVVAALLALDEPYRATLIASFFDGLDARSIAARDGVPVETVRTRTKRGLQRLRERLLRGGGASAVALVHGLQLGKPGLRTVLARLGHGVLFMQATQKIGVAVGLVLLATAGWFALRPQATIGGAGVPSPAPMPAANPSPPAAAAAPVPTSSLERTAPVVPAAAAPTGSLAVRVVWPDQRPAANIAVRVGAFAAPNFEASVVAARTDATGRVRFEHLAVGEVLVDCDRGAARQCAIRGGETTEALLAIAPGVRVNGHVFDLDGRAAAGAEIWLVFRADSHAGHVVGRSGDDGSFAIDEAPAERTFAVSALLPQRAPTPQHIVTGVSGAVVDVDLRFEARGGAVAGRVVDAKGEPVAGALVLVGTEGVFDGMQRASARGMTLPLTSRRTAGDAKGDWLVDGVAVGDTPVLVIAPGMAPWRGKTFVIEGATVRCDAVLSPAARLVGSVRDERGVAVVGAAVRVGDHGLSSAYTKSGADGSFALDGLPLGLFAALAKKDGAGELRAEFVGSAGATLRWDAVLVRATTLVGRVVAAGRPVAEARVSARCMPASQQQWFADASTDAAGRFELTNCPDALLHLEARTRTSQHFVVAERDDVDARGGEVVLEVDPAREPSAVAVGRVLDPDGKPIAGADVTLLPTAIDGCGGHAMRTAADGTFRSPPCPPGEWFVTVKADGWAPLGSARRSATAGATMDWGDLVCVRGHALVVTIQPDAGVDLDGLVVGLADANCGIASERPEHGVVRFPNLGPGDYVLTTYAPGAALRRLPVHVGTEPETAFALRIAAGTEVTVDVRDPLGQPVIDRLETELIDGKGEYVDRSPMMPGNGPMLWIRRLVPDRYELRLRDHRRRVVTVPLVVPADGKPMRLTATF